MGMLRRPLSSVHHFQRSSPKPLGQSKPNLSCLMTKPTKWHVRPAKTQADLSLRWAYTYHFVGFVMRWLISCGASMGRGNENLFGASDQDGHHAHI